MYSLCLCRSTWSAASLYGLPKVHKPGGGDKMRPINSTVSFVKMAKEQFHEVDKFTETKTLDT